MEALIDWNSSSTSVFLNPRFPEKQQCKLLSFLEASKQLKGHIWLSTSGSTALNGKLPKMAALSKEAFLASAKAVNQHLNSDEKDIWVNPLPLFHTGGLAINARCYLSHATEYVFEEKWNPVSFCHFLYRANATITALVPAQVYDLVVKDLSPTKRLRAVIVGGGALQEPLYQKAKALGWKLLPSYGLTECASQVATVTPGRRGSRLKVLPHIEIKVHSDGTIWIRSPSLLTAYATETSKGWCLHDPKIDGWLPTNDIGIEKKGYLQLLGRADDFVKVGGESVALTKLEKVLEEVKLEIKCLYDVVLIAVPDERLGHVIRLVTTHTSRSDLDQLVRYFNESVLPYERIRLVHFISSIPYSPLGKVLKAPLLKLLGY